LKLRLATITFSILALELTLIRWMSQQVRVFAYFNNLLLIAAFLGIGIGAAMSRWSKPLVRLFLPSLFLLSIVLRFSERLGLMFLSFPDRAISMWGAEGLKADETFAENTLLIALLFCAVAWLFVCLGARLAELFEQLPPLRAYAIDLGGSLLGVIAAVSLAALATSPPWWIAAAALPVLIWHSRDALSAVALAGAIVFAALSIESAQFSPYNRIDLRHTSGHEYVLSANRDHHQYIRDFSAATGSEAAALYEIPFRAPRKHDTALVVGAGTGNDVAAALRSGYQNVDAVEIDPVIHSIGRQLHPERPYDDPRVRSIVTDARIFVDSTNDTYDAVCFGLLDSHSMFSSMSTLRLDNYVYTTEALRNAWRHVGNGGVMSISFLVFKQHFIAERMARNLREATGAEPVVVRNRAGSTFVFLCAKGMPLAGRLGTFERIDVDTHIRPSTDDWPFLYIRPGTFPRGYVVVLGIVLLLAVTSVRAAYGAGFYSRRRFDVPLFLFGAAFLLIETRSVTNLSLLFGSTWIVNAAVFAGVLIVAAISNAFVERKDIHALFPMALLLLSLAADYAITTSMLTAHGLTFARVAGVLLNVLPIGFAGVLFSTLLRNSPDPVASLGSNLIGAVAGGVTEYASMILGLRAMMLVAAAIYVVAFVVAKPRLRAHVQS
jgi:spermidine synthase